MGTTNLKLTSHQAAQVLSIHESTIKRLCNSDQIKTTKTSGGHRRIDWFELMEYSKNQNISHHFSVYEHHSADLYLSLVEFSKKKDLSIFNRILENWMNEPFDKYIVELINTLVIDYSIPFTEICDYILYPILEKIGTSWEVGKISIGQEHRISQEFIKSLILLREKWFNEKRIQKNTSKSAIIACSKDNEHEISAQCIRIILELNQYNTIFLGAKVPTIEALHTQIKEKAELICISFSPIDSTPNFKQAYSCLTKNMDKHYPFKLAFGGHNLQKWKDKDLLKHPFIDFKTFTNFQHIETWLKA